ncbi:MAG: RdgB/HAM1 family non-canonical purine NTP pyrophosphatase [Acidimicrobiales bacterium]
MAERLTVVAATANPDKLRDMQQILEGAFTLLPRPAEIPEVIEDADSLAGNARLKAAAIVAHTGQAAIADDTGLFVDALDGAPGVHSARFAGEDASYGDNVSHMLRQLDGVPLADRTARFSSVVMLMWPDGRSISVQGDTEGIIIEHSLGDHGFGYDPIFVPNEGDGMTFAQMTADGKHTYSHRGKAIRSLLEQLP